MCRCIAGAVGCRISDVRRPKSRLQSILISPRIDHFRRRVVGRKIVAVRRLGKRVVLVLDSNVSPLPLGEGQGVRAAGRRGERRGARGEGTCAIVLEPRMTGLGLADRSARSGTPAAGLSPERRLGPANHLLGSARLGRGKVGHRGGSHFPRTVGAGCPRYHARDFARAAGGQSAGGQSGSLGSARLGRHRQPVRLGNPPSRRHSPGRAVPPASPGGLAQAARGHGRDSCGGHPPPRLDPARRHVSHRAQSLRRLSDFPPRL